MYLYAIPRGVCLVLKKETMKVPYLSIKQIMEKLPEGQFVQCHRMYVVNRSFIDYVDIVNRIIRMKNLQEVEIGVTYKTEIRGCFMSEFAELGRNYSIGSLRYGTDHSSLPDCRPVSEPYAGY